MIGPLVPQKPTYWGLATCGQLAGASIFFIIFFCPISFLSLYTMMYKLYSLEQLFPSGWVPSLAIAIIDEQIRTCKTFLPAKASAVLWAHCLLLPIDKIKNSCLIYPCPGIQHPLFPDPFLKLGVIQPRLLPVLSPSLVLGHGEGHVIHSGSA